MRVWISTGLLSPSERGEAASQGRADEEDQRGREDVSDSDKEDAEEERLPPHLQILCEYAQS
jgi:hypothetical protein